MNKKPLKYVSELRTNIEDLEDKLEIMKKELTEIEDTCDHDYKFTNSYTYDIKICKKCGYSEFY